MGRCYGAGCKDKSHSDALFIGDKRATSCADCAYALPWPPPPKPAPLPVPLPEGPTRDALESVIQTLGDWLTSNTEEVFEEEPHIDGARSDLHDLLDGTFVLSEKGPKPKRPVTKVEYDLGKWLSAALEDPTSCEGLKRDIKAWFDERGIV
jgi:hypothetical protein